MSDLEIAGHSFDELARLAKDDPDAFEAVRKKAIQASIASAQPHRRARLAGLQWQIDVIRWQSDSPLQACSKISDMMWESVVALGSLRDPANAPSPSCTGTQGDDSAPSARIIPFDSARRSRA